MCFIYLLMIFRMIIDSQFYIFILNLPLVTSLFFQLSPSCLSLGPSMFFEFTYSNSGNPPPFTLNLICLRIVIGFMIELCTIIYLFICCLFHFISFYFFEDIWKQSLMFSRDKSVYTSFSSDSVYDRIRPVYSHCW